MNSIYSNTLTQRLNDRKALVILEDIISAQVSDTKNHDTLLTKKTYYLIFLDEIKKSPKDYALNAKLPRRALTNCLFSKSQPKVIEHRNIGKMIIAFKCIPFFKKFLILNQIDDMTLKTLCETIKYRTVQKDQFLFKKDDPSDLFYCIIHGKIALKRPDLMTFGREKLKNLVEQEICQLTTGDYFGEWGLMEQKPRTASAYALEDTTLFALSLHDFEKTIGICMKRNQMNEKEFVMTTIPAIITSTYFNVLFKTLEKFYLFKNQVVYNEGDYADKLYIVYKGEFAIKKKIRQFHDFNDHAMTERVGQKSNKLYCTNQTDFKTMVTVSRGEVVGLESIKNYIHEQEMTPIRNERRIIIDCERGIMTARGKEVENNKDQSRKKYYYETTLLSTGEENILFLINKKLLPKILTSSLKEFFMNLYDTRLSIIRKFHTNSIDLKKKTRIIYREGVIKSKMHNYEPVSSEKVKFPNMTIETLNKVSGKKVHVIQTSLNIKKLPLKLNQLKKCPLKLKRVFSNDTLFQTISTSSKNSHRQSNGYSRNIIERSSSQTNTKIPNELFRTIQNYKNKFYDSGTMDIPLVSMEDHAHIN